MLLVQLSKQSQKSSVASGRIEQSNTACCFPNNYSPGHGHCSKFTRTRAYCLCQSLSVEALLGRHLHPVTLLHTFHICGQIHHATFLFVVPGCVAILHRSEYDETALLSLCIMQGSFRGLLRDGSLEDRTAGFELPATSSRMQPFDGMGGIAVHELISG